MTDTFTISLIDGWQGKKAIGETENHTRARPMNVTLEQFTTLIRQGKRWCGATFKDNYAKSENFIQSQILALDIDQPTGPIDSQVVTFVYPTPSATPEHPRWRMVFVLDKPITDRARWEQAQAACWHQYRSYQPDKAIDAARRWYGAGQGEWQVYPDRRVTDTILDAWITKWDQHQDTERREKELARIAQHRPDTAVKLSEPLIAAVTAQLGVNAHAVADTGFSKVPVQCPVASHEHDDTAPAFYWHTTKFFGHCFKCGADYTTHQLADALGIDTKDYYKTQNGRSPAPPPKLAAGELRVVSGIEAVKESSRQFVERYDNPEWRIGLRSNITSLDRHLGGFAPGGVYTFLGETGSGKTTLCASLAYPFCGQGKGLIVSCENSAAAFIDKMVAYAVQRPYGEIRRAGVFVPKGATGKDYAFRRFTESERDSAQMARQKIYGYMANGTLFSDGGSLSPTQLLDLFEKHGQGVQWAIVDSLNNIVTPGFSEYENVTAAAHTCEWLAVKHDIPIIATAQGGRNTKGRAQKRLMLHDGRGSGAIEEKGFAVIAIYNQWHLEKQGEITDRDFNPNTKPDHVEFIIRKLRDGEVGKALQVKYIGGAGFYQAE
jgi:hypothetical protein